MKHWNTVNLNNKWSLVLPPHRQQQWQKDWEAARLDSMADHLLEGDQIIYIGAEEGDMPALLASWGCQLVLMEPGTRVWANIRQIWEANDLEDPLLCFEGFAGGADRNWRDGLPADVWPTSALGPVVDNHGFRQLNERPDIPSVRVDTLLHDTPIAPVGVSVDVEGSELLVLQGMRETIKKFRPFLWVSIHPQFMRDQYGHRPEDLHNQMTAYHYFGEILEVSHEEHWLFTPSEML